MKEAILEGERHFVISEVPEPVLDSNEVLIKVHYCGICGSDLHTYIGGVPTRYGHKYSGEVVAVGSDVTTLKKGDRVTAECALSCGECFWCKRGEIGLCESFYLYWAQSPCGFATYTKNKYHQLHKLPPMMSYEEAALAEPTAVALHAVNQSQTKIGDVVAVLGLGPIGQLVARLTKVSGARKLFVTEASHSRINLIGDIADEIIDINTTNPVDRILELTEGRGVDIVFECSGAISATQQSLSVARRGGTVVLAGICLHSIELLVSTIALKELTVRGAMIFHSDEFATALNLIAEKKIDVKPLITAILPLEQINEGFEKAVSGDGGKILIKP